MIAFVSVVSTLLVLACLAYLFGHDLHRWLHKIGWFGPDGAGHEAALSQAIARMAELETQLDACRTVSRSLLAERDAAQREAGLPVPKAESYSANTECREVLRLSQHFDRRTLEVQAQKITETPAWGADRKSYAERARTAPQKALDLTREREEAAQ